MHRARHLLCASALAALTAAPAADATPVTVQISGTWDSVVDNANVFGGTVTAGTPFSATLVYDDATSDSDPDPASGAYDVPPLSSDLSLTTATFSFTPGAASVLGIAIDNASPGGEDAVFLFADGYTATGLPANRTLSGTRYANPTLKDSTGTAVSSDALTGMNWAASAWSVTNFYFFSGITGVGLGAGKFIELSGTISGMSVLPEPSLSVLAMLVSLIASRRVRG